MIDSIERGAYYLVTYSILISAGKIMHDRNKDFIGA